MSYSAFEVKQYPWSPNTPHLQRLARWVERMKIVRPNTRSWGVFYDPVRKSAQFHEPSHPDDGPRAPKAKSMQEETPEKALRRPGMLIGDIQHPQSLFNERRMYAGLVRTPVATVKSSARQWTENAKIVALERKYPVDGLHYVRMASTACPSEDLDQYPRLLVDTGCAVTWLYHPDVTLLNLASRRGTSRRANLKLNHAVTAVPTDLPLARTSQARYYSTQDATRIGGELDPESPEESTVFSQYVQFSDSFTTELELYRGPLHLIHRYDDFSRQFTVCSAYDMAFGLAVSATPETVRAPAGGSTKNESPILRMNDHMDGVFGLGLGCDSSWATACGVQPELFVPKFCESAGYRSMFTLSLARDDPFLPPESQMKSWLVLGSNNKGHTQDPDDDIIPHLGWSQPMESRDPEGRYWVLELESFVVGGQPTVLPNNFGMIVDTGGSMSTFPPVMYDSLLSVMGAGVEPNGSAYVDINDTDLNVPVILNFRDSFSISTNLKAFLDPHSRRAPTEMYLAFQQGLVKNTPFGLIGNTLLRGLVMEFEYSSSPWVKSKMRAAFRNPKLAVRID